MQTHTLPRRFAKILFVLALFASATSACANEWSDWLHSLNGLTPDAALHALEQAPAVYRQQADYYYWLGVYTLKAGKAQQAIEYFEHTLMLDPDHAGALYDYGLAQCQVGNGASCRALLDSANARFGTPPALKNNTERPYIALAGEFRSNMGRSSNLNFGSGADYINLHLDGQDINLMLSDSSREQSAWFTDGALDVSLTPTGSSQYSATFSAYGRKPVQNHDLIGIYRALASEFVYAPAPNQRIGIQSHSMTDSMLGSLTSVGGWWQMQYGNNGTQTLLMAERRSPSGSAVSFTTIRAEWATLLWRNLEGRVGAERDMPDGQRTGGSQQRWSLGLRLPLQVMEKGRLEVTGRLQHTQDSTIYSPLFGNDARNIQTLESRLRFSWPLASQLDLRLEARYTHQRSNIALFDLSERMGTIGIAAQF